MRQPSYIKTTLFFLAALIVTTAYSQNGVQNEVTDEAALRDLILQGRGFNRGEQTVIYLHLRHCLSYAGPYSSQCGNWQNHTAIFFPRVDYLSRLEIPWSFGNYSVVGGVDGVRFPESVEIALSVLLSNGTLITSDWKRYVDDTRKYVVGSWTAFAYMDAGHHVNMTWQEGCDECTCFGSQSNDTSSNINPDTNTEQIYLFDCSPQQCITNVCGVRISDCTNVDQCPKCTQRTCDIKVYIGWAGTEGRNWPLNSYGSVPSAFTKFAITRSYRAAAGIITKADSILWVGG